MDVEVSIEDNRRLSVNAPNVVKAAGKVAGMRIIHCTHNHRLIWMDHTNPQLPHLPIESGIFCHECGIWLNR